MTHTQQVPDFPPHSAVEAHPDLRIFRDRLTCEWRLASTPEQWVTLADRINWALLVLPSDMILVLCELSFLQRFAITRSVFAAQEPQP